MLILDTHVWVWLFDKDPRIRHCAGAIEAAADDDGVGVSAISMWEIGMLVAKRRLTLNRPGPLEWLREALAQPGLTLVPLTPEIAVESAALPGGFRSDPADHIIVATARIHNATLVTRDQRIVAYGQQGFVKVLPV